MTAEIIAREFVSYARQKLDQQFAQVRRCTALLNEAELWHRANQHANSVGNLLLHLNGNLRQWLLSGLGGEPFDRDRPAEFAQRGPLPATEIVARLEQTICRALSVLERLDAAALADRRTIQGYDVSGVAAVFHAVEHFCSHAAQIVHITKTLKSVDLSLYDPHGRRLSGAQP